MVLCEFQQKAEFDKLKIQAAFFGVNLDGETKKEKKAVKEENVFTFKDPKEYEHMVPEERKKLTEKMMGKHKEWVGKRNKK